MNLELNLSKLKIAAVLEAKVSALVAKVTIVLFLGWLFYFGWVVAERAFYDSDTCWLLAMGHWIVEHGNLPNVDPFCANISTFATLSSFTSLVEYQWLAEIVFYLIYHWTSIFGLLALNSFLAYLIFICLPYSLLTKVHCHKALVLLIISVLGMASTFSFYVRPQMFSCLFLAVFVYLYIPSKFKLRPINRYFLLFIFVATILWTNTHIFLLPIGIAYILMLLWSRFVELRCIDNETQFPFSQVLLPFFALSITGLNPWGFKIWAYVIRLIGNPNNSSVSELQPIGLSNIDDPAIFCFDSLLVVYFLLCLYYSAFKVKKIGVVSPVFLILGSFMTVVHCKLLTLSNLFILTAYTELISRQSDDRVRSGPVSRLMSIWNDINERLSVFLANKIACFTIALVVIWMGSAFAYIYKPITIPQTSWFFVAPFKAIEFIKAHKPNGRVFNNAMFGSMMTLYVDNPDVFIDTRFSQYDPEIFNDYICLENCGYGWRNVLQKYNFGWTFVQPGKPIAKELTKMGWNTLYRDETAVIMTRGKE